MNTHQAAEYCGVTESIIRYVARRDGFGTKQSGRLEFTFEELDRAFGASAPFVARLQAELARTLAELRLAREVVEAAERACEASLFDLRGPLVTAIARYRWTVQDMAKARSE